MSFKMKADVSSKLSIGRCCFLILLAGLCFLLTVLRWALTGKSTYFFLNGNLLLAAVPWVISLFITSMVSAGKPKILSVILFVAWFLFFPNAPYIVTDLYYLNQHGEEMFWYDLIMIVMFAWTGLLYGFFSLDRIEAVLNRSLTRRKSAIIIGFLLFVFAFGVYLGRDLRWNSWDIFFEPKEFFLDVLDRFTKPICHGRTWGFTFFMGILMNVVYWSLKYIQKKPKAIVRL